MNKNVERFIQEKVVELLRAGFSINLKRSKRVDGCNGYFSEDEKELAVAIGKPQKLWIPILVHEYSHFCQWREDAPVWKKSMKDWDEVDIWGWLDGSEEYTKKQIDDVFLVTQELEQDCDKRAVEFIKEYDLPFCPERYIQKANAYHWFYEVAKRKRKFYVGAPYQNDEIVDLMPTKFLDPSRFKNPPKQYVKKVLAHCF